MAVPFNGNVSQTLGIGYNLLGNPYPSPLNARAFLTSNPNINTLYYWTHTAAAVAGSYPVNNYASYTTLGGVASAAGGAVPDRFYPSRTRFLRQYSFRRQCEF